MDQGGDDWDGWILGMLKQAQNREEDVEI